VLSSLLMLVLERLVGPEVLDMPAQRAAAYGAIAAEAAPTAATSSA
jgi:hypothetical protein